MTNSDNDLAFFVLLARRESFTDTARELGITASAASRRLARLENRLGVRLLNRTTRRMSLTGEGETYFRLILIGMAHPKYWPICKSITVLCCVRIMTLTMFGASTSLRRRVLW